MIIRNTPERLKEIFKGDEHATQLMLDIAWISHVWDDLIDKDVERTDADINQAFYMATIGIHLNPFCRTYWDILWPVMANSVMNYIAANYLEEVGTEQQKEIAYNARHALGDIAITMAQIIGGYNWAAIHSAELKAMANEHDTLDGYKAEHSNEDETPTLASV